MSFLEILFIISIIQIFIMWVWFIILGFRANKAWGFSIIFFSPVTPFMFASRFARKARRAIYYYAISLVIFILFILYIQIFTVNFYSNFLDKIIPEEAVKQEIEVVEIDTEVPDSEVPDSEVPDTEVPDSEVPDTKVPEIKQPIRRSYKVVDLKNIQQYVNKKVKVLTSSGNTRKGTLISATSSKLIIKGYISGQKRSIPIKRSKIKKVEVYL